VIEAMAAVRRHFAADAPYQEQIKVIIINLYSKFHAQMRIQFQFPSNIFDLVKYIWTLDFGPIESWIARLREHPEDIIFAVLFRRRSRREEGEVSENPKLVCVFNKQYLV
jgi:hypothetical protein